MDWRECKPEFVEKVDEFLKNERAIGKADEFLDKFCEAIKHFGKDTFRRDREPEYFMQIAKSLSHKTSRANPEKFTQMVAERQSEKGFFVFSN